MIDRAELAAPGRPLGRERWAGVVDTCRQPHAGGGAQPDVLRRGGGRLRAGAGLDLPGSVAPFILRGVTLCGINSVMAPKARREVAWARLANDLDLAKLDRTVSEVGLSHLMPLAPRILKGEVRGRVVVNVAD